MLDLILREINERLRFLENVGLDYLTLIVQQEHYQVEKRNEFDLATQIGSRLTGVLYILDEPSIGLHQRDNDRLIENVEKYARYWKYINRS